VSHDRYFLNRVADLLIVFANGTTEVVYGNYDTYELLRQAREGRRAARRQPAGGERQERIARATTSDAKSAKRKRKFPYRKVAGTRSGHRRDGKKIANLEAALQSPDVYPRRAPPPRHDV